MAHRVFNNDHYERRFREDGFVRLPSDHNIPLADLLKVYKEQEPSYDQGFHTTMFAESTEVRATVHQRITEALWPVIGKHLNEYEPLVGNFIVKEPGESSYLEVHQDWTFVQEPDFESVNFWLPLVDVSPRNGCLRFLRGSHAVENYYRSATTEFPFKENGAEIEENMESLYLKAGELVAFSSRMIHGSHLNNSQIPRVAITFNTKPKAAKLIHIYRPNWEGKTAEVHEVPANFYNDYKIGEAPRNGEKIGEVELPVVELKRNETINSAKDVANYYNDWLGRYQDAYGHFIQAFRPADDDELMRYMVESISLKEGDKVLDVGCGIGGPSIYLKAHYDISISGLNISSGQLGEARKAAEEKNLDINFIEGDYHQIPNYFEGATFDKLLFFESLGHSPEPEKVTKGAYEVLKPGGEIYIKDFFFKETYREDFRNYIKSMVANIDEHYCYNTLDFSALMYYLRKAGFEITFIRPFTFDTDIAVRSKFEEDNNIDLFEGRRSFPYADWLEIKCRKPLYEFEEWG